MKLWTGSLLVGLFTLGGTTSVAQASECASCSSAIKPESGFWHTKGAPGAGFTLRIYGTTVAGAYFGFEAGKPEWLTFSGRLNRNDEAAVWQLSTEVYAPSGTGCFGCVPIAGTAAPVDKVEMEFFSRTTGRYRAEGGAWLPLDLFAFGIDTFAELAPASDVQFPDLEGPWVLVFTDPSASDITSKYFSQSAWAYGDGGRDDSVMSYLFSYAVTGSESEPLSYLVCKSANGAPVCTASQLIDRFGQLVRPPIDYQIRSSDISAVRFKGTSANGATLEGFRVGVD